MRSPDSLRVARRLPPGSAYLRRIVEELSSIGSSPLGFRTTGTPEDRAVAELVAAEMREIGLADVEIERVPVDGWRFMRAALEVDGGAAYEAASMGGVPPTPVGGIVAPLVDVGTGERRRLDRLVVDGRIALVDWASASVSPSEVALELGLRGAVGMVLSCPTGGPYYQGQDALGSFDSHWHSQAPPMITLRREDVADLRSRMRDGAHARLVLDVELARGTSGHNVVGYLPGERSSSPLVVGAHHDGWFRAAFDNASGVAAMLGIARGLAQVDHRPAHGICFTSRTAEEYGLLDCAFDWCTGAWQQVSATHPEWGESVPFHLCVEASGHPGLRLNLQAPPELVRFARASRSRREGRGLADERMAARRTRHRHRAVAAAGLRHPGHRRVHLGAVVRQDRLPLAARHDRAARLRSSRPADEDVRAAAARGRPRSGRHPRSRRARQRGREARRGARRARRRAAPRRRGVTGRRGAARRSPRSGASCSPSTPSGSPAYPHEQALRDLTALELGADRACRRPARSGGAPARARRRQRPRAQAVT